MKYCFGFLFLILSTTTFAQTESAIHKSSFGVFSSPYDHSLDLFYWQDSQVDKLTLYTGLDNNSINLCGAFTYKGFYAAFSYNATLTNYKAWPQNMTDETEILLLGFPRNWSVLVKYYDYCYSGGRGTAEPSIGAAKNIEFQVGTLRLSAVADLACRYSKAHTMDLFQPATTITAQFSRDADNGIGFSYTWMPTLEGTRNSTDVSEIPVHQKISAWYGKIWDVQENLRIGFRPNVYWIFNAVNPVARDHNVVPESGNIEGLLELPLSLMIRPGSGKLEFVLSLMTGLYYANFDHEGWAGLGGNNDAGWVPETGIGCGITLNINSQCSLQIGSQYIRVPELTEDHDRFSYTADDISANSILQAPLSVSLQLKI